MTKHEAVLSFDKILSSVLGKFGTTLYRILLLTMAAITLGIVKFEGPRIGNDFIADSPAVTAIKAETAAASITATAATVVASEAKTAAATVASDSKISVENVAKDVSTIKATQDKIFDGLKQVYAAEGTTSLQMASVTATLTGLSKQVDRIEAKQDK